MTISIKTITVSHFQQNARIITDPTSTTCAIIDPGAEPQRILNEVPSNTTIESIILTHSHIDHCGGVKQLLLLISKSGRSTPILYGHNAESMMRGTIEQQAMMFGVSGSEYQNCPEPEVYLEEGESIKIGNATAQVKFVPGHSPGHIVLYFDEDKTLIAGDTLFAGSIGRTDLPGGDHDTLIQRIHSELLTLPDDTQVLPGHGPNTRIGKERQSNPFLA